MDNKPYKCIVSYSSPVYPGDLIVNTVIVQGRDSLNTFKRLLKSSAGFQANFQINTELLEPEQLELSFNSK